MRRAGDAGAMESMIQKYDLNTIVVRNPSDTRKAVSYLKMMGMTRVRYKILSVCGNWKPPSVPLWEDFVVEYSREEIDQVWTMILRNREAMEKQRAKA